MVDFSSPFHRGLSAAKQAQENRDEVRGVFAQFNEALREISQGRAEIAIVPLADTLNALSRVVLAMDSEANSEHVLAVRNPQSTDFRPRNIARWKQSESGYPCSVLWGQRHTSCDNAESLTKELSSLFSTPMVGEAIEAAMNHPPVG
ncbi:hypothetical protein [Paucibacter sp. XJ19-41]|uniref:hypothetical protein n=1 Tax=Paucibacter sp. XJ19-41 TaxID=2927824 RepID=UPI00234B5448|nr:hypothetical protein [Paucibacter sp. XJ19-41]MDC6170755.1 hypothetical protein [Paucibacter sp. XJ19-41]